MKHQEAIETAWFDRVRDLFGFEATVTLYDLTNTYFEGVEADNPKAKRGHSKEMRSDCPLLTMGLILDGSGFPKQGGHSAGVAPQYCGALGKTANCQSGVFICYSSAKGHALLDSRLYLPQRWFESDYQERRQRCSW